MTLTMIFAGSGGQGIQFSGKQMAKTGMYAGYQVTFLPSYGPEMRGGTSNCTVVISDEEIGSPSVSSPDVAVVMNKPSFEKVYLDEFIKSLTVRLYRALKQLHPFCRQRSCLPCCPYRRLCKYRRRMPVPTPLRL